MRDSGHDKLIVYNSENICNECVNFHHECYGFIEELEDCYCTEECKSKIPEVSDAFDNDKGIIINCLGFESKNYKNI